jgi:hypothetical protein
MAFSPRLTKAAALVLSGAALGGAGGYAASASGASTSPTKTSATKHAGALARQARLRHAVSITAVVPDGRGHFSTLSIERGTLVSVSGQSLTLNEGSRRYTYKSATLSLPSDVKVRLSHQISSLSALAAGDLVEVVQGPKRTAVIARPPKSATVTPSAG